MVADDSAVVMASQSLDVSGMPTLTATEGSIRSALAGEIRETVDAGAERLSPSVFSGDAVHLSNLLVAEHAPAAAVTELLRGTDIPAQADHQAHAALVADAVVMPAANFSAAPMTLAATGEANANAEVAQVLAEALSGGGGNPIDALLHALPGNAHAAVAEAIGGWDAGHMAAFVSAHAVISVEALAIHVDAPPLA